MDGFILGLTAAQKNALLIAVGFQKQVVIQAQAARQPHTQAILRDEGHADAAVNNLARGQAVDALVFHQDGAACDGMQAGDGLAQLLLAAAGHARYAQNFTGAEGKAHIFERL